ncbi:patatin-like phospholipase family protein [Methylomagnum ishizawai]|uniref:patatin-like phospholipase family protein n=1 Tax=Methylomagnum ishizawai TaxID=1760988 RepID=UPI001C337182|nr:patatin-like phospholipase family protein [Methylomagnum ishizawai]BBL75899.1 hypothetical protein MishRS11D_29970 [Methylomagnum ishizawai]
MAKESPSTFRIGLVMAGAVSAGAYTAGVVDFLMEALETWEREKRKNPNNPANPDEFEVPNHTARIDVVTGASAGSIAGAVFASAIRDQNYPDLRPEGQRQPTRLYQAWVQKVDIRPMLGLDDLEKTAVQDPRNWFRRTACCLFGRCGDTPPPRPGAVASILNSDALDAIANQVINVAWTRADWPGYLRAPLALYFTVTNLRGVPYSINFTGEEGSVFGMSQHADYMSFLANSDGQGHPRTYLPLGRIGEHDGLGGNWDMLKRSALASGAFPVGLAARVLERTGTAAYDERCWAIPNSPRPGEPCVCKTLESIEPSWPQCVGPRESYVYEFVNVDGGVANNEPFELARRFLANDMDALACAPGGTATDKHLPRSAIEASASVLMVDPFPNDLTYDCGYAPDTGLIPVLKSLVGAMLSQLRFKTEDLELAKRGDVHSRWIISPKRSGMGPGNPAIASATLGAFGGFLHWRFRDHDYQLGRRNCQRFLQTTFLLHRDNPVFAGQWPGAAIAQFGTEREFEGGTATFLPIIPLYGECAQPVPEPAWPKDALTDFTELHKLVKARAQALTGRLIETNVDSCLDRGLMKLGLGIINLRRQLSGKDNIIADGIITAIKEDLQKNNLLSKNAQ